MGPLKKNPHGREGRGEGEGGEPRFVVFYEGLRLWEAHLCVFYGVWRPREVPPLTKLRPRVGPLQQTKHPRIEEFTCLEGSGRLNVSYSTCLEAQNVDKFITFA